MNSKDFAIGILSTTAVILFVGVILVNTNTAPVWASGMGDSGGDYIVLSGALFDQEELLYVIDTAKDRMLLYRYDLSKGQIVPAGGEMLQSYFKVPQTPPPGAKPKRP